jgi:hypothetical protein
MKLLTEYLEHALQFERLAAQESNPELKALFESQAAAYRKLVAERAQKYGLPPPSRPLEELKCPRSTESTSAALESSTAAPPSAATVLTPNRR